MSGVVGLRVDCFGTDGYSLTIWIGWVHRVSAIGGVFWEATIDVGSVVFEESQEMIKTSVFQHDCDDVFYSPTERWRWVVGGPNDGEENENCE